jgi:hypothetical protein
MKKERWNSWPSRNLAPEVWTHDLNVLFKRLGVDPETFDMTATVAPALKTVLDWRREHGYSVGTLPLKWANDICAAAFDGDGVVEWLAKLYQLNI